MQIKLTFLQVGIIVFDIHVKSTQNRKLVIYFQYIKKKVLQLLLYSIIMQNIQIFYGGPVMFVVTCFI